MAIIWVKVSKNKRENESQDFLKDGDVFLGAAQVLFRSNPLFMYPAAFLCHLGIELLLKGCLIWEKSEYPKDHRLLEIGMQISFLKLTQEYSNLLEKIDTLFFFRYPLNEEDAASIENTLKRIKDITSGEQNLPREIGTDDWYKVKKFYTFLVQSMPDSLLTLYNKVRQQ